MPDVDGRVLDRAALRRVDHVDAESERRACLSFGDVLTDIVDVEVDGPSVASGVSVHEADPEDADEVFVADALLDDEFEVVLDDVLDDVLAEPDDDVPELHAAATAPRPSTPNG